MKEMINKCKLLIFDLDGTLYEDTDHFDYYANLLKNELPIDYQQFFLEEYERMKKGNHVVQIGKAYDIKRDAILTLDPMSLEVIEVHNWNGQLWNLEDIQKLYQGEVNFDFENIVAIGDGWWLPFACAKHFGLKDTHPFYEKAKEYMVTENFQLTKTPGLREGLLSLQNKHLVLMTNSDKDDVNRLLTELNLVNIFPHIIPFAQKPRSTTKYLQELLDTYKVQPNQAVSIGDNFINEIAPALKLGMNAIFIQANKIQLNHQNLIYTPTLSNVFLSYLKIK